jgi:4,5-DOPA dioxygenase extradiol
LLYIAGLAAAAGAGVEPLVRGYAMGAISMTCYGLGAGLALRHDPTCAARLPAGVPPDQTNM